MPDRRHDLVARERIVQLEARYRRVARELTLGLAATTLGFVLAIAGVWHTTKQNHRLVSDQQRNRVAVLTELCEVANAQNRAIRRVLVRFPDATARASVREFPINPNCRATAQKQIRP